MGCQRLRHEAPAAAPLRFPFWLGALFELMLLGLAAGGIGLLGRPWLADFHWRVRDLVIGVGGAGPLLVGFYFVLTSAGPPCRQIREFLEQIARPALGHWNRGQLIAIALLAGVGEEALFRGAIQGGLESIWGTMPALLLASFAFGLGHAVTRAYAVLAALMGVYLGALWVVTGNLLVPIVTHAVYDGVALVWYLRRAPPERVASAGAGAADGEGPN
jgi:hypothetical protein